MLIIIITITITNLKDISLIQQSAQSLSYKCQLDNVRRCLCSEFRYTTCKILGKGLAQWCDQNYVSAIFRANSQTDETFSPDILR
jgi:hypothetical protein